MGLEISLEGIAGCSETEREGGDTHKKSCKLWLAETSLNQRVNGTMMYLEQVKRLDLLLQFLVGPLVPQPAARQSTGTSHTMPTKRGRSQVEWS